MEVIAGKRLFGVWMFQSQVLSTTQFFWKLSDVPNSSYLWKSLLVAQPILKKGCCWMVGVRDCKTSGALKERDLGAFKGTSLFG